MFKVGDRVVFTNIVSWHDDFNGYIGTVIDCLGEGMYDLLMDRPVGIVSDMRELTALEEEIQLVENEKTEQIKEGSSTMEQKSVKEKLDEILLGIEDEELKTQLDLSLTLLNDIYVSMGPIIEALEAEEIDIFSFGALQKDLIKKATMFDNLADIINLALGENVITKMLG